MFKRIVLALTFVAALGAASLGTSGKAVAWHDCHGGYGYGYQAAYYPVYNTSYYGYGYAPRVSYYPGAYPVYYQGFAGGHHRHHHNDSGLSISFGF